MLWILGIYLVGALLAFIAVMLAYRETLREGGTLPKHPRLAITIVTFGYPVLATVSFILLILQGNKK